MKKQGSILILILVIAGVSVVLIGGLVSWGIAESRVGIRKQQGQQAFQIAEAGINYYRWHLAHAPDDFQDGTGGPGPYVHDYEDKNGDKIGEFSLEITAPPIGSTEVIIESTGYLTSFPSLTRTIRATMAIPSLAKYAVVANDNMRFGSGTEVFGEIHANGGVRFDGVAHNIVASAKDCYDDPDTGYSDPCERPGVWTSQPPPESDVFLAGTSFPVPSVDFNGFAADLAQIKADAQDDGVYIAASGKKGWLIELKTDDTYDLWKVRTVKKKPGGCYSQTYSINKLNYQGNFAFPNNGLIFVEDHAWVRGQIDGARLTIAAARFPENPSTYKSIYINEDLTYTNYDGTDSIGLFAQDDVAVGLHSENYLQIDAALVAQKGRVFRHYYNSSCGSKYIRQELTLNGMIATNQRYGFAYTDGTGYQIRNLNYDGNLLYMPPPSFPTTGNQYSLLSWEELKPDGSP